MDKRQKPRQVHNFDFQVFRLPAPARRCDIAKCKYAEFLDTGPAEWGTFHRYRGPNKESFRTHIYCPNHCLAFAENHQLNEYSMGRPLGAFDENNPAAAPEVRSLNELIELADLVKKRAARAAVKPPKETQDEKTEDSEGGG